MTFDEEGDLNKDGKVSDAELKNYLGENIALLCMTIQWTRPESSNHAWELINKIILTRMKV